MNLMTPSKSAVIAVIATTFATSSAIAASPSFSCKKAKSTAERAICASPALSAIDRAHARLFVTTVAKASSVADSRAVARVRAAEGGMRTNRDTCRRDAACIRAAYLAGNAQMTAFLKQLD